ncbi:hypothetical protein AOC36_01310 [Erysipelothrix larvae]|uniref:Uncharacterized protein n=1 Tax=Erysipelothrix larvae TaxID=1514105 RepID=A0A0X8GYD6_9FIRM|nr:glycosyltransferase [Erysipelothrix larvae]AMC92676.1 hypothetical protein AOC36_01310 [Erysipelothrix larvae]
MIKVLHVVSDLGSGGVESLLYTYYKYLNRKQICFDFIVHEPSTGMLEKELKALGSKIYHVTPKKKSLIKNFTEIRNIINYGNYDVVHSHLNLASVVPLYLAKKAQVGIRINHSHSVNRQQSIQKTMIYEVLKKLNHNLASHYFAASCDAGTWLHGIDWKPTSQNLLVSSVIDLNQFIFRKTWRDELRRNLNLRNKIILLHVGRFSSEKNHPFLIDIIERLDDRFALLLVGDGATRPSIEALVKQKKLDKRVHFVGTTHNVGQYMSASDIFLLPSIHEGFGIVLVEAQASDLPIFASNTIPRESEITELIEFLPIDSVDHWVDGIMKTNIKHRISRKKDLESAGYTLEGKVKEFETWLKRNVHNNHE